MPNILVTFAYHVDGYDFAPVREMSDLSRESYQKHLQGSWFEVHLTGHAANLSDMFADVHTRLFDIVSTGTYNALFVGADTLCVKDIDPFWGGWNDDMLLFSEAGCRPPMLSDPILGPWLADWRYLNIGTFYWGKGAAWLAPIGQRYYREARTDHYDFDQYVINRLYWQQPWSLSWPLLPHMNYTIPVAGDPIAQPIPPEEAAIFHFASSRGINLVIARMKELAGHER